MCAAEADKTVHLTDRDTETAEVIKIFLGLITTWRIPAATTVTAKGKELSGLIGFLLKYECKGPVEVLAQTLIDRVDLDNYHETVLLIGKFNQLRLTFALGEHLIRLSKGCPDMRECTPHDLVKRLGPQQLSGLTPHIQWSLMRAVAESTSCSWKDVLLSVEQYDFDQRFAEVCHHPIDYFRPRRSPSPFERVWEYYEHFEYRDDSPPSVYP